MRIIYKDARNKLAEGAAKLSAAVGVTLGPKGRNVVINSDYYTEPIITKDGVTVAREFNLPNSIENIGAKMLREAASKTVDAAGDGTTTATILGAEMIMEGVKRIVAGVDPIVVKRQMDDAVALVVAELREISESIGSESDKIKNVATISGNNDESIGDIISDTMTVVGTAGVITIEEGNDFDTKINYERGLSFNRGYLSPFFINKTDEKIVEFDNPSILITNKKITGITDIAQIVQEVNKSDRPLLVIAEDYEESVMTIMALNVGRGNIRMAAVLSPTYIGDKMEMLKDIAVVTGAEIVADQYNRSLDEFDYTWLGSARKVRIDVGSTIIVDGGGDKDEIEQRCLSLDREITKLETDYAIKRTAERASKMRGGVAVIKVGAHTEIEMKEKKDRIEDALLATRAAVAEGIVPGGGIALLMAGNKVFSPYSNIGEEIIDKAIKSPFLSICRNAGKNGDSFLLEKAFIKGFGIDANTGRTVNMKESGIIDPTKVVISALQNAVSVAGMVILTECILENAEEKEGDRIQ